MSTNRRARPHLIWNIYSTDTEHIHVWSVIQWLQAACSQPAKCFTRLRSVTLSSQAAASGVTGVFRLSRRAELGRIVKSVGEAHTIGVCV